MGVRNGILSDLLYGSWSDKLIATVFGAFSLSVVSLIACALFAFADTELQESVNHVEASIISRSYIPAHTTTTCMIVGKAVIPQTVFMPAQYRTLMRTKRMEKST